MGLLSGVARGSEIQTGVAIVAAEPGDLGAAGVTHVANGSGESSPQYTPAEQGQQLALQLCGGADPEAERTIEQFIAGRAFSATLTGRGDGCADLVLEVSDSGSGQTSGQGTSANFSTTSTGTSSFSSYSSSSSSNSTQHNSVVVSSSGSGQSSSNVVNNQSTSLSIITDSGTNINVKIVTENGVTKATVGASS
jgi:hypothetical protein